MSEEIEDQIRKLYENCDYLKNKNRKLEDRTRRCNLRIDGVNDEKFENWSQMEEKLKTLLKETLHLQQEFEIECAHGIGSYNDERPGTIIFKLLGYKDKEVMLQNAKKLKDTGIYIYEDFSDETNMIRRSLN